MNNLLSSCIDFCLVHLDDIVIFSCNYDEHLIHLEQVLNTQQLHNLTLNKSKSFHDFKHLLVSHPLLLNFPDDTQPVLSFTDASKVLLGGVLYQEINGVKKVLYYHSELLSSSQQRYHPIELEALAILKCISRMKSIVLGRSVIIYTDNYPLCDMVDTKALNKRVEPTALLFQEFNVEHIIHVTGKHNCLPDYLSRHPISYDEKQLDSVYGWGFKKDKSTCSIKFIGVVVVRSKAKVAPSNVTSPLSSAPSNKCSLVLTSTSSSASNDSC
ncbi:unnamed protein product [Rotaria sp. Silwood2]|nr:unnamed protein product [Rotaria sp. Silwood2]